jgi:hypothetical protein
MGRGRLDGLVVTSIGSLGEPLPSTKYETKTSLKLHVQRYHHASTRTGNPGAVGTVANVG